MDCFEPKMKIGDKLKSQFELSFTAEQRLLFKSLAEVIFKDAINMLISSSKIGYDSIDINLDVEHLYKRYMFNKSLYKEAGVRRELEKLAEAEDLKIYPYGPAKILITF